MTWFERLRKTRRKLVKKNGRRLLQALDRYLGSRSLVGDHPFFEPGHGSDLRTVGRTTFEPVEARPLRVVVG